MQISRRAFLITFLVAMSSPAGVRAAERLKDGYFATGVGIREKSIAFVDVDVYEIRHFMKELPPKKSKQAVIDLDVDKRIMWKMLRDVGAEKMRDALSSGYEMNGWKDKAKADKFVACFQKEMTEGSRVTIVYDATKKATTINVDGGGSATVEGVDFMRATWSIWFGKIDQPELGDAMIKSI